MGIVTVVSVETDQTNQSVSMGPDSVLVRGVLWLLFQGQVFAPDRDLISEGAYMRMRGAKQWKWSTDASFRSVHDLTHEDIRGNYEPLGMFWVRVPSITTF